MKKLLISSFFIWLGLAAFAQYQTPGTGVNWNLDSLVYYSGGVVNFNTGGQYTVEANLTIAASDTLSIIWARDIFVTDAVLITIKGILISNPQDFGVVFFKAANDHYLGFRFEDSEGSYLERTYFENGGGIKLVNAYVEFKWCNFTGFNQENSTGVINLFHSSPLIEECNFTFNDGPAVMSGANVECSPQIFDCEIKYNVAANANTPQINLGSSGSDSIRIINNTIIGNRDNINSGGIAITTLAGGQITALIQRNIIRDNRYGITAYGSNIASVIVGNEIADNNTEGLPMMGGSGINFYGSASNVSLVSGNVITGNLWGVTIQNSALPNFGQLEGEPYNVGANTLMNNGNGGEVYDLYNNTPNTIMAQNNYWGTNEPDSVEMHIFHQPDDPSLGLIEFLPIFLPPVSIDESSTRISENNFSIYPNPAQGWFYLKNNSQSNFLNSALEIEIRSINGELLQKLTLPSLEAEHRILLPSDFWGVGIVSVKVGEKTENFRVYNVR